MPSRQGHMSGQPPGRDATPARRDAQRRRTRRAIVEATQQLLRAGSGVPSVDAIAATADVSRRTVYMYFPTLDQLLLDAAVGALVGPDVDAVLTADAYGDARDRVDALVCAVLDSAAVTLPMGRQIIRLTVAEPAAREAGGVRRGYRRVQWLERALEPLRSCVSGEQFDRLVSALAVVVGWEAMTVLRDIRGLAPDAERDAIRWAARALIDAMLAEAAAAEPPAAEPATVTDRAT